MLQLELKENRRFDVGNLPCAQVFADARGEPPRLAAVVVIDDKTYYTDWQPPDEVLQYFERRKDGQIMGLELLAEE